MIILHLSGGLGNQMFQYAFGRALATRLGVRLKFELSDPTLIIHNGFELGRIFNIRAEEASAAEIKSVLGLYRYDWFRKVAKVVGLANVLNSPFVQEPHFYFSDWLLQLPDNSYLVGYWQSEKYFSEMECDLRSDYAFKLPLSTLNMDVAERIGNYDSVGLHVRRNDFANNPKINSVHGLCSLDYYRAAIQYVCERVGNPYFFIFSDDPSWVKNNLAIDQLCEFVEHNRGSESYNDMRLMSLCKHHIIANSSFSWWGAWLNPSVDKIVVSPKQWFANDTDTRDLIPDNWVRI